MKKQHLIFLLGITLFSCSPKMTPLIGYNAINNRDDDKSIFEKIAKDSTKVNRLININSNFLASLTIYDPIITYNNSPILLSNYKLFHFHKTTSKGYTITLTSMCDCFGFHKYMFIPNIIVFNKNGNIIKSEEISNRFDYPKMSDPLSNIKTWKIDNNVEGDISVLVYSNNSKLDSKIFRFIMIPLPISVYIKSSLIGDFYIKVEENK